MGKYSEYQKADLLATRIASALYDVRARGVRVSYLLVSFDMYRKLVHNPYYYFHVTLDDGDGGWRFMDCRILVCEELAEGTFLPVGSETMKGA